MPIKTLRLTKNDPNLATHSEFLRTVDGSNIAHHWATRIVPTILNSSRPIDFSSHHILDDKKCSPPASIDFGTLKHSVNHYTPNKSSVDASVFPFRMVNVTWSFHQQEQQVFDAIVPRSCATL